VEDVGFGLVFWSWHGHAIGVGTPLADAFIALASTVLGRDLRLGGRTLESLGSFAADRRLLREQLL